MNLLSLENWPLLFISIGMIVCGVVDGLILKVPNKITLPIILSGWLLAVLHMCGLQVDGNGRETGIGWIGDSLACTLLGFVLLIFFYAIRAMGAGDVKMQMGFGAWVGAFFGWELASGFSFSPSVSAASSAASSPWV